MTSPFPDPRTDSLTGLYNRRFFDETLSREVARANRHLSPLTMLLLDVDHFNQVCDAHGHVVGHDVLKAVAKILRSLLRRVDFVFSAGEDKFAVLLPCTDLKGGLHVRDRARSRVEADGLSALRLPENIAVTISVCEYKTGEGKENFIIRAKRGGGDEGEAGVPARI